MHAERLIKMFESGIACMGCPAVVDFRFVFPGGTYCRTCNDFLEIKNPYKSDKKGLTRCPCFCFGENDGQEAIKRTWIALEEKGYI